MKLVIPTERSATLIDAFLPVWERSVRATHTFLSDAEIATIKSYVPEAFQGVQHLVLAYDDNDTLLGFMGINEHNLEMLFLDPAYRSQGLGRTLLQYGINNYGVDTLTVNEQNPDARGFYEHMGFVVFKRTERDEQGGPYPLLYLRREA